MAQTLPISSFDKLSATDNWGDFKREALLIAKTQPELWDAIADLAEEMFDGGCEAVLNIRQVAEAERAPKPFVRRIGKAAPKEDYRALLAGIVSKLHELPPSELDQLIKEGEADPEINVEEEEETAEAAQPKSNLPALIPSQQPATWDDALDAMNEQHAIIENVGGKTVIASWEPSPTDLKRLVVVFQTKESFILRYSNRTVLIEVTGKNGTRFERMPLGQWWLGHRERLQFRGVTFQPGGPKAVNRHLNLWQGGGVDPAPGDWGLIRQHIDEVIANGNEEFAEYVIRWIAWAIQNPAAQAEVA